jgi:hypothetical protein
MSRLFGKWKVKTGERLKMGYLENEMEPRFKKTLWFLRWKRAAQLRKVFLDFFVK